MFRRTLVLLVILGCGAASSSCSSPSLQTDPLVKEERASGVETGPVIVAATLLRNDRSPMIRATFHLMAIERDAKGELSSVTEHLGTTGSTNDQGNLQFELPRGEISGTKEFSLGYRPSGMSSVMLHRGKEMLTFKADAKTRRIDLGEVVMEQF